MVKTRWRFVYVLLLLLALLAGLSVTRGAFALDCRSGVGGRLFSTGGQVQVEILPSDAGFTTEIHLISPGPSRFIGANRDPGRVINLGTFEPGAELIFGIHVRETQQSYMMGSGAANPDGRPHAEVSCFGAGRAKIGFEDVFGGGDGDFNDASFNITQTPAPCTYSISEAEHALGPGGGSISVTVSAPSGCNWTARSNSTWIAITSGSAGSDDGLVTFSVAPNTTNEVRVGDISVEGQVITVRQEALGVGQPLITGVLKSGKRLIIFGVNFDPGAMILLNGIDQRTKNDAQNPTTSLVGKKAGKKIKPGDMLRIMNPDRMLSPEYRFGG
jgi:hypothetical protein